MPMFDATGACWLTVMYEKSVLLAGAGEMKRLASEGEGEPLRLKVRNPPDPRESAPTVTWTSPVPAGENVAVLVVPAASARAAKDSVVVDPAVLLTENVPPASVMVAEAGMRLLAWPC